MVAVNYDCISQPKKGISRIWLRHLEGLYKLQSVGGGCEVGSKGNPELFISGVVHSVNVLLLVLLSKL